MQLGSLPEIVVITGPLGVDGFLKNPAPESNSDAAFVPTVLDALRQWQFSPVKLNGSPQECQVTVTATFEPGKN